MTIFVVIGAHGQYSDRSVNVIKAFKNGAKAAAYIMEAEARHRVIENLISGVVKKRCSDNPSPAWHELQNWMHISPECVNEFDPNYEVWGENSYYMEEVELL